MQNHKSYLIHLPHCGLDIPEQYKDSYFLSDEELAYEAKQYADLYTDRIFEPLYERFGGVKNSYSRLLFDPERFFDDATESMHTEFGLGWYYINRIKSKKPLRDTRYKDELKLLYWDHHDRLNSMTKKKLEHYDICTIIDCHSFSNERYWFHDADIELPDICIGFEEMHKDHELVEIIKDVFAGYAISINKPYNGSLVPTDYWRQDSNVKSVMIEINKKLYLEDDNVTPNNNFRTIQNKIETILKRIDHEEA